MDKNFSKKICELRELKGLSQAQLAKLTNLPQSNISRWELNQSQPKLDDIITLANFFDISTDYLLGLENDFGVIERSEQRPALITKNPLQTEEDIEMKKIWQELTIKSKWIIIGRALAILEEQKKNQR